MIGNSISHFGLIINCYSYEIYVTKDTAKRVLRKGIFAVPRDIFPVGKVIYFLVEM